MPADVPLLLGLDVLDNEKLVSNNVQNELQEAQHCWSMPLTRKHGQLYLTWNSKSIVLTKSEIIKLHRHFKNPTSGKRYEVMNCARRNQVEESTRKLLKKINEVCETCQTFSAPPQRLRVSLPQSDIVFNLLVELTLLTLRQDSIPLHYCTIGP